MIVIKTWTTGVDGYAEAHVGDKTLTEKGRTIANALSNLTTRIGRMKGLNGEVWMTHDNSLRGTIGDKIKKKRVTKISEMPGFELHGGVMHSDQTS